MIFIILPKLIYLVWSGPKGKWKGSRVSDLKGYITYHIIIIIIIIMNSSSIQVKLKKIQCHFSSTALCTEGDLLLLLKKNAQGIPHFTTKLVDLSSWLCCLFFALLCIHSTRLTGLATFTWWLEDLVFYAPAFKSNIFKIFNFVWFYFCIHFISKDS